MARTRRIKTDRDAHYHLMSRTNDRRFLFEAGAIKTELAAALRRAAEFCGIALKAYAVMSNHFHVVAKVVKPDEPVGQDELLRRVGVLRGEKAMRRLAERWDELAAAGMEDELRSEQDRLRARMHDISEFVKLFKEEFDRIYKRNRAYCGSIWSGRFASTLIEDGEYLSRCVRYVVYNPIRAGLATQAKDYTWCWREGGDESEDSPTKPERWYGKRVVQIGMGGIFGSFEFVTAMAFSLGDRFSAGASPHPVGRIGHATHGWRIAKAVA